MSKALVIKGANFMVNKVETISLATPIPCTGISISENAISFSQIGATDTLTVTLTPANTTDDVVWTSSDEDVATVNNGVVTCIGVGTATITVACGTQMATCTVTSSVTMILTEYDNGYGTSGTSLSTEKDYVALYSSALGRVYCLKTNTLDGYQAFSDDDISARYPYPLPHNAHQITINISDDGLRSPSINLLDSQLPHEYVISGATHDSAKAVSDKLSMTVNTPLDISDYIALADGFVLAVTSKSGSTAADITSTVVSLTFE